MVVVMEECVCVQTRVCVCVRAHICVCVHVYVCLYSLQCVFWGMLCIVDSPICLWTVFVSKGGVTAEIVRGNITCMNGALHFIDTLLGYIYNTAKDEIELNPTTQ